MFKVGVGLGNFTNIPCRFYSPSVKAKKLVFHEFGDPPKVVKFEEEVVPEPKPDEVLIEMLVASINPADINIVQGVYPIKPRLPGVPGNEGVGKVLSVGRNVKSLCVGDRVMPNTENLGTWRSHGVFKETSLMKVRDDIPLVEQSATHSNGATAYRMLKDFVALKEGDVVLQNGANSAAGQHVVQLCHIWGYKSVNIVRDRPNIAELKSYLTGLGATHVLTEEEFRKTELFKSGDVPQPKLALNCVGGKSSTELIRKLAPKGIMVTYGGMSREPVIVPTAMFIFKDIEARGFWITRWTNENRDSEERKTMLCELMDLIKENKLVAPTHKLVPISEYTEVLSDTVNPKGLRGMKYLFDFRL
ncbi:hypothetical protein AAG570_004001 [Ranatra chinensis]|uniref:Enoyl-[acyl-carrier-protein] reductase, mitochondrial n=1 Tax=Ranatra chinensis TaxID=642074 RepID=A0ABD0Y2K8_9HEMI